MPPKRRRLTRDHSVVLSADGYDAEFETKPKPAARRPRKSAGSLNVTLPASESTPKVNFTLSPLVDALCDIGMGDEDGASPIDFDIVMEGQAHELLSGRERYLKSTAEYTLQGQLLREITPREKLLVPLKQNAISSKLDTLLNCKTATEKVCTSGHLSSSKKFPISEGVLERLPPEPPSLPAPDSVTNALESIGSTPFSSSFASRIAGPSHETQGYLFRDWSAQCPWTDLLDDIHEFHAIAYPDRSQQVRVPAPIDYQALRESHLPQLHDLLSRTFWPGVNVSDLVQYSPDKCTVVALYRHLVVGAALLSSPKENYITYLVVRSGWEGSQVATKMLYLLLKQSPQQDVILHVSANNPAMLLYNRFGFKAEEFIVGFYDEYLSRNSKASKNAFRLRLRR